MAVAEPVALLDEIIEFLAQKPTLGEIVAFRPSEALESRLEDLLDKNRAGRSAIASAPNWIPSSAQIIS